MDKGVNVTEVKNSNDVTSVTCDIKGNTYIGGFIGYLGNAIDDPSAVVPATTTTTLLSNVTNVANVKGMKFVGGVVGYVESDLIGSGVSCSGYSIVKYGDVFSDKTIDSQYTNDSKAVLNKNQLDSYIRGLSINQLFEGSNDLKSHSDSLKTWFENTFGGFGDKDKFQNQFEYNKNKITNKLEIKYKVPDGEAEIIDVPQIEIIKIGNIVGNSYVDDYGYNSIVTNVVDLENNNCYNYFADLPNVGLEFQNYIDKTLEVNVDLYARAQIQFTLIEDFLIENVYHDLYVYKYGHNQMNNPYKPDEDSIHYYRNWIQADDGPGVGSSPIVCKVNQDYVNDLLYVLGERNSPDYSFASMINGAIRYDFVLYVSYNLDGTDKTYHKQNELFNIGAETKTSQSFNYKCTAGLWVSEYNKMSPASEETKLSTMGNDIVKQLFNTSVSNMKESKIKSQYYQFLVLPDLYHVNNIEKNTIGHLIRFVFNMKDSETTTVGGGAFTTLTKQSGYYYDLGWADGANTTMNLRLLEDTGDISWSQKTNFIQMFQGVKNWGCKATAWAMAISRVATKSRDDFDNPSKTYTTFKGKNDSAGPLEDQITVPFIIQDAMAGKYSDGGNAYIGIIYTDSSPNTMCGLFRDWYDNGLIGLDTSIGTSHEAGLAERYGFTTADKDVDSPLYDLQGYFVVGCTYPSGGTHYMYVEIDGLDLRVYDPYKWASTPDGGQFFATDDGGYDTIQDIMRKVNSNSSNTYYQGVTVHSLTAFW